LLNYAKSLKFDEQPNYERIQKILRNTLQKEGIKPQEDIKYDWSSKVDQIAQQSQASEKRKALHGFLINESKNQEFLFFTQFLHIEGKHFPTIVEESWEDAESCILDFKQNHTILEDTVNLSPQMTTQYHDLQSTPKLDSVHQPSLRTRAIKMYANASISEGLLNNPQQQQQQKSPWNCSDTIEDRDTIVDKVKLLNNFKATMGIN